MAWTVSQMLILWVGKAGYQVPLIYKVSVACFLSGIASTGGNRPMEAGQLKSTPVLDGSYCYPTMISVLSITIQLVTTNPMRRCRMLRL